MNPEFCAMAEIPRRAVPAEAAQPVRDGGPAFSGAPQGMVSVRDYFAAMTIAVACAECPGQPVEAIAVFCYGMADAMLIERDK